MNPAEAPVFPAGRPVLGIHAKSLHAERAGRRRVFGNPDGALTAKTIRYTLQRAAARLLFDPALDLAEQPNRVVTCNRSRKGEGVSIYRSADGSNARFSGLVTCGSVWHCPVCSAKVSEARRQELQAGLIAWKAQGGEAVLMTLTQPHYADTAIGEQLEKQANARQRFKNCRTFKRIMARYGRAGSVASLEVTWGVNGWHPHVHELIFCRPGLAADAGAIAELRGEWIRILMKVGLATGEQLADLDAHALDIRGGNFAADYVAKFGRDPSWSEAHELTKSHAKIGKRGKFGAGHVTPFMLLQWYLAGDAHAGALFAEYAKAFEGKRMLSYSPGLKKTLGIADLADAELADADDAAPAETMIWTLSAEAWRLVLERDARGELLFVAAKNGADGIRCLLYELEHNRPKTHRGESDCFVQRPTYRPFGAGWNEQPRRIAA